MAATSDTPRTDAVEFEIDERGAPSNFVVPVDFARQLERDNVELGEILMSWFIAASPWATPGSLEEGIQNLRNEVIEECAGIAGHYAKLMNSQAAQRAADEILALKNAAPRPPVTPHRSTPGLSESSDSANGGNSRQPCETGSGDTAAVAASERPCTCHPNDNPPVPCPRKHALTECRKVAIVRQAIFHVLDGGKDGLEWDFDDDEDRVDFADAVVAWLPAQTGETPIDSTVKPSAWD